MAKTLDLPAGTPPARARALQALAKKGRVTSEKLTVRDTGQTRVKLHKDVSDAVTVQDANGNDIQVWPEDAERYRFQAEVEQAWQAFVKEHTKRDAASLKIAAAHADDPEQYNQEDAETFAGLLADFRVMYPQYDPNVGPEEEA